MVKTLKIFSIAVFVFAFAASAKAEELSNGSYTLYPDVFTAGGEDSSSMSNTTNYYDLVGSLGQTVVYDMSNANNSIYGGFWNESTLGIFPPTGSVTIGTGIGYTTKLTETLTFLATDTDGTIDEMRFTDDGDVSDDVWVSYTTYATHTFTDSTEGVKTIHAQFRDNDGFMSSIVFDTSFYDITAPSDGTVTTSTGNSVIMLILGAGFTDGAGSGIGSYQILMDQTAAPLDCNSGTLLHDGSISGSTFYHYGAINGESYYYRVCATDNAGNQSAGVTTASVSPSTAILGISYPTGDDASTIIGIERTDQGTDTNNLDIATSKPKLDTNYLFQLVYKTNTGAGETDPLSVKVFISDRTDGSNFQGYDLTCSGSFNNGAYCLNELKLGPATIYQFYFEIQTSSGAFLTEPTQNGPTVEMLNGYTMVGLGRDLTGLTYDGLTAFDNADTQRWSSGGLSLIYQNYGGYTTIDTGSPAINGEGYFVKRGTNTVVPEHAGVADNSAASVTIPLVPGWNIISNPYNKHINLSNIRINRVGDPNLISWTTAASYGIVVNAIYYYQGSDWGSTYGYESAGGVPEAKLAPWLSYWVYLTQSDTAYELIFNKP